VPFRNISGDPQHREFEARFREPAAILSSNSAALVYTRAARPFPSIYISDYIWEAIGADTSLFD
jgi:hypothetical protein